MLSCAVLSASPGGTLDLRQRVDPCTRRGPRDSHANISAVRATLRKSCESIPRTVHAQHPHSGLAKGGIPDSMDFIEAQEDSTTQVLDARYRHRTLGELLARAIGKALPYYSSHVAETRLVPLSMPRAAAGSLLEQFDRATPAARLTKRHKRLRAEMAHISRPNASRVCAAENFPAFCCSGISAFVRRSNVRQVSPRPLRHPHRHGAADVLWAQLCFMTGLLRRRGRVPAPELPAAGGRVHHALPGGRRPHRHGASLPPWLYAKLYYVMRFQVADRVADKKRKLAGQVRRVRCDANAQAEVSIA